MKYIEKLNDLYEQLRLDIIKKVQEIGIDSEVGFKTIRIDEDEEDLQYNLDEDYLVEIGEDYLFNNHGHSYNFSVLDFEDLCNLVDYLNTLK